MAQMMAPRGGQQRTKSGGKGVGSGKSNAADLLKVLCTNAREDLMKLRYLMVIWVHKKSKQTVSAMPSHVAVC